MFNLSGRFSIIFLLFLSLLDAETFKHFKSMQIDSFTKYKDKRDIEFAKYLKHQFKAYNPSKEDFLFQEKKTGNHNSNCT